MVERIKNKKGFTIIEIMVVIALIGILAAVLVPRFSGVKDAARDAGMLTNARMVEAYAASLIDSWTADTDDEIVTAIQSQFTEDNALTNPYNSTADDTNIVVASGSDYATGETTDADADAGKIYVVVDNDEAKIYINGFNSTGSEILSTRRTVVK